MIFAAGASDGLTANNIAPRPSFKSDAIVGLTVFTVAVALSIAWGFDSADDPWFLYVSHRLAHGEVLYRDVHFHVTPLSAYLMTFLVRIFGTHIDVLRFAGALVFTGIVLGCCRINAKLGGRKQYPFLLLLSLFLFASPGRMILISFYSHLAGFFLLVSLLFFVSWQESQSRRNLMAAGVALGLCFATKHSTGSAGFVAALLTIVAGWAFDRKSLRVVTTQVLELGVLFGITVFLSLVPVVATGALPKLLDDAFSKLTGYWDLAGIPYFAEVSRFAGALGQRPSLLILQTANSAAPYFLPLLLGPMLIAVIALGDREAQKRCVAIGAFALAGLTVLVPRADKYHLIFATPIVLIGVAYCWRQLVRRTTASAPKVIQIAALLWVVFGCAQMSAGFVKRMTSPEFVWSEFPHFELSRIPREMRDTLQNHVRQLALLPRDNRTFIVSDRAGFYYLASGASDPTPFDYPYATNIRGADVVAIQRNVSTSKIRRICVDRNLSNLFRSRELDRMIATRMVPVSGPEFCQLYVPPTVR